MVNHTVHEGHDPDLAFAGHLSLIVFVEQTRSWGLHCEDCGWFGGSFEGRWVETQMVKAWAGHEEFIARGGVIEHGHPTMWAARICLCPRCRRAASERSQS